MLLKFGWGDGCGCGGVGAGLTPLKLRRCFERGVIKWVVWICLEEEEGVGAMNVNFEVKPRNEMEERLNLLC